MCSSALAYLTVLCCLCHVVMSGMFMFFANTTPMAVSDIHVWDWLDEERFISFLLYGCIVVCFAFHTENNMQRYAILILDTDAHYEDLRL